MNSISVLASGMSRKTPAQSQTRNADIIQKKNIQKNELKAFVKGLAENPVYEDFKLGLILADGTSVIDIGEDSVWTYIAKEILLMHKDANLSGDDIRTRIETLWKGTGLIRTIGRQSAKAYNSLLVSRDIDDTDAKKIWEIYTDSTDASTFFDMIREKFAHITDEDIKTIYSSLSTHKKLEGASIDMVRFTGKDGAYTLEDNDAMKEEAWDALIESITHALIQHSDTYALSIAVAQSIEQLTTQKETFEKYQQKQSIKEKITGIVAAVALVLAGGYGYKMQDDLDSSKREIDVRALYSQYSEIPPSNIREILKQIPENEAITWSQLILEAKGEYRQSDINPPDTLEQMLMGKSKAEIQSFVQGDISRLNQDKPAKK